MKKLLILTASTVLLLSACGGGNSGGNSGTSRNSGNNSGTSQNEDDKAWNITFSYIFNSFTVKEETKKVTFKDAKSDKSVIESKYVSLPNEYEMKNLKFDDRDFATSTDHWTVSVKAKYDGYMVVKSNKSSLNNQIIPASILSRHYYTDVQTVNNYDGSPVSFSMEDITEIKFKNSISVASPSTNTHAYNWDSYTKMTNLTKIDVSELKYVKEIPAEYFAYFRNLTTINVGNAFKNVTKIGARFLAFTSISGVSFDFSGVKTIGDCFLYNALTKMSSDVTVKLKDLTSIGARAFYQYEMSGHKVNIELNDIIPDSTWLTKSGWDYTLDFTQSLSYPFSALGTYNFTTNYADNLKTVLADRAEGGATIIVNGTTL